MIYIENKKRKVEKIQGEYPNAVILDITSNSETRYAKILSPFYPHRNIPIPFTEGLKATCVEAIWQGLKVFEDADVDFATFRNDTMRNLKRTVRKYGVPKGHRKGAYGKELLGYFEARMLIYLPTYKWVLDNVPEVHHVIERIKEQNKVQDIVLLDYNTNIDFRDASKPLSHAGLVKLYIEGRYPDSMDGYKPMSEEEIEAKRLREKETKKELKKKAKEQIYMHNNSLFEK
jgi:muconolactone delta-isomerase